MRSAILLLSLTGCISGHLDPGGDDVVPPAGVTDPIGTADTLDVGAWNLKNFPCGNASDSTVCRGDADKTPALVAKLIASLDVDLLAVEEIDDEDAFHDAVVLLPGYDSVLSQHTYFDGTYQKVGFVWKTSVLDGSDASMLFVDDDAFPRPPLQMRFSWKGPGQAFSFIAIAVHLKAGGAPEDFDRRTASIAHLESYLRGVVDGPGDGDEDIVVMGDFNELITDGIGLQVFAPLTDTSRYTIRTKPAAQAGAVSFLPSDAVIDHIVTTAAFDPIVGGNDAVIPRIDADVEDYLGRVSDHLPVFLTLAAP